MSASTNVLQRSLHHYNSSPCLSNTSRLFSLASSASNSSQNNVSTTPSRQIVAPKPVKVINNFSPWRPNCPTNNDYESIQQQRSSAESIPPKEASDDDVMMRLGNLTNNKADTVENLSTTPSTTGTPERLANEEIREILFSRTLGGTPTPHSTAADVQRSSTPTSNIFNLSDTYPEATTPKYVPPLSPPLSSNLPFRSDSPPTIELSSDAIDLRDSLLEDDNDYFDEGVLPLQSVPSTFGYDEEDFHLMRQDQKKKRNFVTQEDISFLIELRTRPGDKNNRFCDDSDHFYFANKQDETLIGAELGLLRFSPSPSHVLNF